MSTSADRELICYTDCGMVQVAITAAPGATLEDAQAALKQASIDLVLAMTR